MARDDSANVVMMAIADNDFMVSHLLSAGKSAIFNSV
jgi:hypothetical protein